MQETIIRNEEDAFRLLEAFSNGAVSDGAIKLEGWPILTITIHGKQFDQSITVPIMKGLIELQSALNRSYAANNYGVANSNRLTDDERKSLEIIVKVEKGSAKLEIDLQEIVTSTISKAVENMDPTTIAITIVSLGVIWASASSFKAYLESKRKEKLIQAKTEEEAARFEAMKFTSAEETKRVELLTNVIVNNNALAIAAVQSNEAKNELLKSIAHADSAEVSGYKITAETAEALATNERRKSVEIRVDGIYRIIKNDSSNPLEFKVRVKNSNKEFDAIVQDIHLTDSTRLLLQQAEWHRSEVKLGINAKSLNGEIKNAVIVSVEPIPSEDAEK